MEPEIRELAEGVSEGLVDQGAMATLLTGSHARGRARPNSDVDLFAVGEGPPVWMELVGGRPSTGGRPRRPAAECWPPKRPCSPSAPGATGCSSTTRRGVGAELQREAREWTWKRVEREADAWVAEKLVAQAEYLPKLAGALEAGRLLDAAALRGQLTGQLAEIFAVRSRLMEESENGFWETIAEAGGPQWREAVERALQRDGNEAAAASGAIDLFRLLVDDVESLLDERQRSVVDYALAVTRNPG